MALYFKANTNYIIVALSVDSGVLWWWLFGLAIDYGQ